MQDGVGRATHSDIQRHRVLEGLLRGDLARQDVLVLLLIVAAGDIDNQMPGLDEEAPAVGMRRQRRAIAGQRQAERLGQAVHRIGCEHTRARAAGRTGRALDDGDIFVADLVVGGGNHGIDQVERDLLAMQHDLAGFHRTAGDEDRGDVETQRRHQHTWGDLVAIRDTDHRVSAMSVDHVFDAVGDQFARRQRIEHTVMAHGDAVIDRDRVELLGDPARSLDLARDELAEVLEVDVARHELGEGVDHGDNRLAEIGILHACGAPEPAGAGHVAAMGGGSRAISGHGRGPQMSKSGASYALKTGKEHEMKSLYRKYAGTSLSTRPNPVRLFIP